MAAGKLMVSVALRMPYVFLPTLAVGLGTTIAHLGFLLGLAELVGLGTFLIGRSIDRGAYRKWLLTGLATTITGLALMALAGSAAVFALGFAGATLGVGLYTASAHSFIGSEVPYDRRGRVIGVLETTWAVAILLGAPTVGLVIAALGWQAPWGLISFGLLPISIWLFRSFPKHVGGPGPHHRRERLRLTRPIVLTLVSSFTASFGSIAIFSTYGSWLEERFGLTAGTIGVLSVAIGGAELVASTATVRFSDQWGKRRSAMGGIVLMATGATAVMIVPKVTALGIAALVVVFLGFEFGFICLLSIASEVGGENRGSVVSVNGALGTVARASSAAIATTVFAGHGMPAAAAISVLSAGVAAAALAATAGTRRRSIA